MVTTHISFPPEKLGTTRQSDLFARAQSRASTQDNASNPRVGIRNNRETAVTEQTSSPSFPVFATLASTNDCESKFKANVKHKHQRLQTDRSFKNMSAVEIKYQHGHGPGRATSQSSSEGIKSCMTMQNNKKGQVSAQSWLTSHFHSEN
jgi:hypothetical protein